MTPEEIQKEIDIINNMSHKEMCSLWRFSKLGRKYFDATLPFHDIFKKRLFEHFGGFTPEISKELGW